jgi:hypothetical protein
LSTERKNKKEVVYLFNNHTHNMEYISNIALTLQFNTIFYSVKFMYRSHILSETHFQNGGIYMNFIDKNDKI